MFGVTEEVAVSDDEMELAVLAADELELAYRLQRRGPSQLFGTVMTQGIVSSRLEKRSIFLHALPRNELPSMPLNLVRMTLMDWRYWSAASRLSSSK